MGASIARSRDRDRRRLAPRPRRYRPVAVFARASLRGSPSKTIRAAVLARLGAELDDPVGARDDVGVVLDDDERVAALDEALEHAEQAPHVREVEARRRLVEHVDGRLVRGARRELGGELEALRLAARERVRALADLHVADAEVAQRRAAGARSSGGPRRPAPRPAAGRCSTSPIESPA